MEYGKFNSAEELLKGYNELEKSFTQKCQQLAELQKTLQTENAKNSVEQGGTNETSSPPSQQTDEGAAMEDKTVCAVPADVIPSAANDGPSPNAASAALPKVMAGGGNVSLVLPTKPKSIKEASVLARQLFEDI